LRILPQKQPEVVGKPMSFYIVVMKDEMAEMDEKEPSLYYLICGLEIARTLDLRYNNF